MKLVVRVNYGDESIALIQWLHEHQPEEFESIQVVYIDTGWGAEHWGERVQVGDALSRSYGFKVVLLKSPIDFQALILERGQFPTPKFQWCAGFLKGIPLMKWLDEEDPAGEWTIALPKRQALYRYELSQTLESCEYHGERRVWHPMIAVSHEERDALIRRAGFEPLYHRSLECDPCVNSTLLEIKHLSKNDANKTSALEEKIKQPFFPALNAPLKEINFNAMNDITQPQRRDHFTMGCGDPFGCGL